MAATGGIFFSYLFKVLPKPCFSKYESKAFFTLVEPIEKQPFADVLQTKYS